MAPLWFTIFAKAVFASGFGQASASTAPAEVADLEAAVQAKYNTPLDHNTQTSNSADADSTPTQGFSLAGVPFEVADLEHAVLAKYTLENWPVEEVPKPAVDVPPEVAKLEAEVKEKFGSESPLDDSQKPTGGLNIRKNDDTAQEGTFDLKNWPVEEVAKAEQSVEKPPTSSLNVRRSEELKQEDFNLKNWPVEEVAKAEAKQSVPSDVAKLEAAVLEKYGEEKAPTLNVRRLEESIQEAPAAAPEVTSTNEPATPAKFSLKNWPVEEVTVSEDVTVSRESSPAPAGKAPILAGSKTKSKKVVMHDMPHYRNHGAAFSHVEPVARKGESDQTATEKAEQRASNLAEKRAEVEEVFHISKRYSTTEAPTESSGWLHSIVMFAAIPCMAVFAYHKYQVILQISERKGGIYNFKAKKDDDHNSKPSFGQLSGSFSSMMGGGRGKLSQRSGSDMGSCEFGV